MPHLSTGKPKREHGRIPSFGEIATNVADQWYKEKPSPTVEQLLPISYDVKTDGCMKCKKKIAKSPSVRPVKVLDHSIRRARLKKSHQE